MGLTTAYTEHGKILIDENGVRFYNKSQNFGFPKEIPAEIPATNGTNHESRWYKDGKLSRDPAIGAALILRDPIGNIVSQQFFVDGRKVPAPVIVKEMLIDGEIWICTKKT
ncbi:hypothetical protein UFOVP75_110 [uncultured Caudovirales phage]|uniref:Uncharacterized protein n=1 Tax=uncultured Caudovirales phage TaxID=2100421 RepID=A0A6J5L113_9CAUD|nr:hypothetical protein UFOVP75_110 [uncultured Caudovirales phage]